jgi:hypothetical protein
MATEDVNSRTTYAQIPWLQLPASYLTRQTPSYHLLAKQYQLLARYHTQNCLEPLNGVTFSQSTQNTMKMTATTPLQRAKWFVSMLQIILVAACEPILQGIRESNGLESERSSFLHTHVLHRSPALRPIVDLTFSNAHKKLI